MSTIIIVVLGVLCVGVLPIWSYSGTWGYIPSGGLGFLLVVLTILTLMGRTDRTVTVKP
jgi:preprotein translocase subunit SecD